MFILIIMQLQNNIQMTIMPQFLFFSLLSLHQFWLNLINSKQIILLILEYYSPNEII